MRRRNISTSGPTPASQSLGIQDEGRKVTAMKIFPDPLQKSQPPTPELLAQFAAQSRAAADEMQKQGIPLPTKPDAIQEPQPEQAAVDSGTDGQL